LFQPAQDLSLLALQSLGWKHAIRGVVTQLPYLVEPASQLDGTLRTQTAAIEMDGPLAGEQGLGQRLLGEMALTQDEIS
jgi:hypothetical protein